MHGDGITTDLRWVANDFSSNVINPLVLCKILFNDWNEIEITVLLYFFLKSKKEDSGSRVMVTPAPDARARHSADAPDHIIPICRVDLFFFFFLFPLTRYSRFSYRGKICNCRIQYSTLQLMRAFNSFPDGRYRQRQT